LYNLSKQLLQGEEKIVIWGAGYIGYSTAAFFAKKGVSSTLIDIDEDKITKINEGNPPYEDMRTWLGFNIDPFTQIIQATSNWKEIVTKGNPVYFVSVNTEKDGEPWDYAIKDVCKKISKDKTNPLVIIESTIVPGWTDRIIKPILGNNAKIVIAPRRDWFTLPGMTVETLDRVIGASNQSVLEEAEETLKIISKKIHYANNYRISELVKSVENAYRNVGISLSYELTLAFPDVNMREVLSLCATKWNMDEYYPSIGIGGYCIPIAPLYVLSGTEKKISLFDDAMRIDSKMPHVIVNKLSELNIRSVCILGIAYKGNLKVHISSPSVRLAKLLLDNGFDVGINDPLYSDEELKKIVDAIIVKFPDEIYGWDCIIVACDHNQYKALDKKKLYSNLNGCRKILDCFGIWGDLKDKFSSLGIDYHMIGDRNWL